MEEVFYLYISSFIQIFLLMAEMSKILKIIQKFIHVKFYGMIQSVRPFVNENNY